MDPNGLIERFQRSLPVRASYNHNQEPRPYLFKVALTAHTCAESSMRC